MFENRIDLSQLQASIQQLKNEISQTIVGQEKMIDLLLVAILADGHVLIEGLPGVAKTLTAKLIAKAISVDFSRIQFTPDLMPSDVLGTSVYNIKSGEFEFKKGPVFSDIVLIDEINRAPAKTQAALFEVMEERQVTMDGTTYRLKPPFLVLATQNPIEQEGTYPLPEAQVDRFMLKLRIDYPTKEEERTIMKRMTSNNGHAQVQKIIQPEVLLKAQEIINSIYIDNNLEDYILNLVTATRNPATQNLPKLANLIQYGASPRASIFLHRLSKAYAIMQGRGFVVPQDIKSIGFDVLRHRVILTYEAEAENICTDDVLQQIFDTVEVP